MDDAIVELRIGSVAPGRPRRRPRAASSSATRSASSRTRSSPGATPRRRCAPCSGSLARDAELVTCISGDGAPLADDAVEALAPDGVELEVSHGGQPGLLVAARRRVTTG
jgi:hypothetical protein